MKYNLVFFQSYQHWNVENSWQKNQNRNKNSCWTVINVMKVKIRFKETYNVTAKSAEKTKFMNLKPDLRKLAVGTEN